MLDIFPDSSGYVGWVVIFLSSNLNLILGYSAEIQGIENLKILFSKILKKVLAGKRKSAVYLQPLRAGGRLLK